jgi:hypothetical protein
MTQTPERPDPVAAGMTDGSAVDPAWDIVDQWGADSFPASDPPANW